MVNPLMLISVGTVAIPIIGFVITGNWDKLFEIVVANIRYILVTVEAAIALVLGYMRKIKLGAMMVCAIPVTLWKIP